ncbi:hypothetical protein FRC04_008718 [Tulasnella sp. 424]|nr:hypothetical protein FRC04_008718 [Tulasnella sp. 424]KAG8979951.1 hypothetical protein FRC05_007394 [Tulasnella sp. 425]
MQARLLLSQCTTKLPNVSSRLFVCHQSTGTSLLVRRRGQNLSARFAPQAAILNSDKSDLQEDTIKAQSTGLSPEGMSNPKTVEAAAKLSNSKTRGHRQDSNIIGGVKVVMPEKPSPPGPEDCCMSGCAVCVNDLYVEALRDYKASLRSIRDKLEHEAVHQSLWPKEIIELHPSGQAQQEDFDDEDLDPATKAFMQMERELKKKQQQQQQQQKA